MMSDEGKCEACGDYGRTTEFVRVRTINGGLLLCRLCLDTINGKNPALAPLKARVAELEAALLKSARIRCLCGGCGFHYWKCRVCERDIHEDPCSGRPISQDLLHEPGCPLGTTGEAPGPATPDPTRTGP